MHATIQHYGMFIMPRICMSQNDEGPSKNIRFTEAVENLIGFKQTTKGGEHADELVSEEDIVEATLQYPGIDVSARVQVSMQGASLKK